MADEFQSDPPPPRRDWGDEVEDRPLPRRPEGMPVWAWLLIGLGGLSLCLVPAFLAVAVFFFRASTPPAPVPPMVEPAPRTVPLPLPTPDKEAPKEK